MTEEQYKTIINSICTETNKEEHSFLRWLLEIADKKECGDFYDLIIKEPYHDSLLRIHLPSLLEKLSIQPREHYRIKMLSPYFWAFYSSVGSILGTTKWCNKTMYSVVYWLKYENETNMITIAAPYLFAMVQKAKEGKK